MSIFFNNRSPIPHDNDDFVWEDQLVWIVRKIQDKTYVEELIPKIKENINEYINQPGNTINDKYKRRTLLSWTAESEKLDIFKYLLENGATDNWQQILKRSNKYFEEKKKEHDKEYEEDLDYLASIVRQHDILEHPNDFYAEQGIQMEDEDFQDIGPVEIQNISHGEFLNNIRHDIREMQYEMFHKDKLFKKRKKLNEYIKEHVNKIQKRETRMLSVVAPYMHKGKIPADTVGMASKFLHDNNDTSKECVNKYMQNRHNKYTKKRKGSFTDSMSRPSKKGGKKTKKTLKKRATSKCRK